jgi:biotin synthase-related radical SAM superfamily protein
MAFTVLFLAHAPDGDAEKHGCIIETPRYYKLIVLVVKDQAQAIEVCKEAVKKEGVQSILLCPGFTHRDIAEISEAVGKNVGIFVARGDGPSNKISMEVMTSEGWFPRK